jgi:Tfp pilus assembly protein PilF
MNLRISSPIFEPTLRSVSFCFLLLCCFAVDGYSQGHTIRGKVRNSLGVNLSRVTVNLETGNGAMINQTVTNNEGDFFFGGLSDTSYLVIASIPDYVPTAERIEFVRSVNANEPGETRTIEITLTPKSLRAPRSGLTFVQDVPKAARDAFEQATRLLSGGRRQEGQAALESAIQIFPDYFDARFLLADEFRKQGKIDEAITHLNEAQRINPKDDRVWYTFGGILLLQHKYAVAARVFAEAASLNPREPQYPLMQGTVLIDQAVALNANSKQLIEERTYLFAEAEKALLRSKEASSKKLGAVYLQLARLYEKRGDRNRAADELERYLSQTSDEKNASSIRDAIKTLRSTTINKGPNAKP